jgi:uncharacterized protein YggE
MKPVLATLSLLLSVGLASANITVTGEGKVKYTPDVGYVNAGVASEGKTAAEAWQKNADVVKKLFEKLKSFGIDAKDMKTAGLNVSPRYDTPKDKAPVLVGYTASYDLNVTVRRLDDLGTVLDGLAAAGANRNMGVSFGCSDPEKLLDEARLKAVREARKKAEIYATGAGCGLGLVDSITEGQLYAPRRMDFDATAPTGAKAESLAIAAGEQELSVQVTVVYAVNHLPYDGRADGLEHPIPADVR